MASEPPRPDLKAGPLPEMRGLEHSLSPIDMAIEAEPLPHPLAWTSTVIAVATLLLFFLNATALRGWAYELSPGPISDRVTVFAEKWYGYTDALGLDAPVRTLHRQWERLRSAGDPAAREGSPPAPAPQR